MSVETTVPGEVALTVLLAVRDEAPDWLERTLQSLLCQSHPGWELCLCDNGSEDPQTRRLLERYRGRDPRIKLLQLGAPLAASQAVNAAVEFATGLCVAFIAAGDALDLDAVAVLAAALEQHPEAALFYSDEDCIGPDGRHAAPYLKPDWSPEHLLSTMYLGRLLVLRKARFLELGGLAVAAGPAADYDLALRATASLAASGAAAPVHLRQVLYHRREARPPVQAGLPRRDAAADQAVLAALLAPRGIGLETGLRPGSFRPRWPLDRARPVTLLILTNSRERRVEGRGTLLLVQNLVRSILERSSYPALRILVVDDGLMPEAARRELEGEGVTLRTYRAAGAFNFSHKLNRSLELVESEDVIILNDDLEVISPDWVEALLEQSRRPEIGAVGARLLFDNGELQHAGMALGVKSAAGHLFYRLPRDAQSYGGHSEIQRNYAAVTAAVMATRLSLLRQVGGFDEGLRIDFNDVDYCLKLGQLGYRVVYTPFATLYHFERSSLARSEASAADRERFLERWGEQVARDPFYHPLLPRDRYDCVVTEW